jgi:hypothetical protein
MVKILQKQAEGTLIKGRPFISPCPKIEAVRLLPAQSTINKKIVGKKDF